jgi:hypothetical protein
MLQIAAKHMALMIARGTHMLRLLNVAVARNLQGRARDAALFMDSEKTSAFGFGGLT